MLVSVFCLVLCSSRPKKGTLISDGPSVIHTSSWKTGQGRTFQHIYGLLAFEYQLNAVFMINFFIFFVWGQKNWAKACVFNPGVEGIIHSLFFCLYLQRLEFRLLAVSAFSPVVLSDQRIISGLFGGLEIAFMLLCVLLRRKLVNAHLLHSSGKHGSYVCPVEWRQK